MTQNASYLTADRVIRTSMQNAGLLERGNDPSSEELADNMNRLNDLIGMLQTQGLKLWTNSDLTIPLQTGKTVYVIGPDLSSDIVMPRPLRCANNNAYFQDAGGNQRTLTALSRDDYTRLSNKTQQGAVNSFFWDKQQTNVQLSFWLTPDSNAALGQAHLIIQNHITYVSSLLDTINFPDEWYMALCWLLADDISTGQPQAIMDRCMAKAQQYRIMLEDWDTEETSTVFQPDMQMGTGYGGYR